MTRVYPKMTVQQHEAVAPLTATLHYGLIKFDINRYPKSSPASIRHRRCMQLVTTLRSRLDDAWNGVVENEEVTKNGFLYYRNDLGATAESLISETTKEMSPPEYAEWLRTISVQVMERVNGYYPVKVLDAALAVERSLHLFRENLIDARPRRGMT